MILVIVGWGISALIGLLLLMVINIGAANGMAL